jgi:xanthine dehydrogenase accessory factor
MSTSAREVLAAAQRLQEGGQPYALVSVLRVQPPASARPGDKAVVTADGIACGWIGGGCAQPAVLKTVRQALVDGRARMVRIAPADEGEVRELDDVLEFGMACHSGGTIELFVDPVLPSARLVVVGDSPVAVALAGLAPRVGFDTRVVAHDGDRASFADAQAVIPSDAAAALAAQVAPGAFVVVATQGRRDLQGLRAALAVQARSIWFVASERKARVLRESLIGAGADADAVRAIIAPAGQPIGAKTPEEIALSVLAAVVAARRGAAQPWTPRDNAASQVGAVHAGGLQTRGADMGPPHATVAPLPPMPTTVGSCCGAGVAGAGDREAVAPVPVAATSVAEPMAVAATPAPPKSCCGG